jgi:hypothetical protein
LNKGKQKSKKNWEVFFMGEKPVFLGLKICTTITNEVYILGHILSWQIFPKM